MTSIWVFLAFSDRKVEYNAIESLFMTRPAPIGFPSMSVNSFATGIKIFAGSKAASKLIQLLSKPLQSCAILVSPLKESSLKAANISTSPLYSN